MKKPRLRPPQTANAFFLTLSSRRRRRIEGREESNASRRAKGHPSIRGSAATQDEAERGFSKALVRGVEAMPPRRGFFNKPSSGEFDPTNRSEPRISPHLRGFSHCGAALSSGRASVKRRRRPGNFQEAFRDGERRSGDETPSSGRGIAGFCNTE